MSVVLFVNSCKKDSHFSGNSHSAKLEKLQRWYSANKKLTADNPFAMLEPQWAEIHISEQPFQIVYEIELKNPEKLIVTNKLLSKGDCDKETRKNVIRC